MRKFLPYFGVVLFLALLATFIDESLTDSTFEEHYNTLEKHGFLIDESHEEESVFKISRQFTLIFDEPQRLESLLFDETDHLEAILLATKLKNLKLHVDMVRYKYCFDHDYFITITPTQLPQAYDDGTKLFVSILDFFKANPKLLTATFDIRKEAFTLKTKPFVHTFLADENISYDINASHAFIEGFFKSMSHYDLSYGIDNLHATLMHNHDNVAQLFIDNAHYHTLYNSAQKLFDLAFDTLKATIHNQTNTALLLNNTHITQSLTKDTHYSIQSALHIEDANITAAKHNFFGKNLLYDIVVDALEVETFDALTLELENITTDNYLFAITQISKTVQTLLQERASFTIKQIGFDALKLNGTSYGEAKLYLHTVSDASIKPHEVSFDATLSLSKALYDASLEHINNAKLLENLVAFDEDNSTTFDITLTAKGWDINGLLIPIEASKSLVDINTTHDDVHDQEHSNMEHPIDETLLEVDSHETVD